MDIEKIIKPEQINERFVDVKYVNNERKVITKTVDVLSSKKKNPTDDWDEIKEKSLNLFASSEPGFVRFFTTDAKEVLPTDLTTHFLMNYGKELIQHNNKMYLLQN